MFVYSRASGAPLILVSDSVRTADLCIDNYVALIGGNIDVSDFSTSHLVLVDATPEVLCRPPYQRNETTSYA
jgi:hypothetical protein